MKRLSIDEIKAIELEVMEILDSVCKAHGIQYFLGYGSLLGAARHGGFIPWDDDMDVVMMRADYEKLMANYHEWSTSDRFALASYRNGSSIYQFAKLVDTGTLMYENFVGRKAATGVWVDIFPLEDYNPAKLKVLRRNKRIGLLRSFVVTDPSKAATKTALWAKRIVCPFVQHMDPVKLARKLDENAQTMTNSAADGVIDVLGEGLVDHVFPKRIFAPIEMPFEDRIYTAPAGYEEFLSIQYGDWRTPPEESDRAVHTMEAFRL